MDCFIVFAVNVMEEAQKTNGLDFKLESSPFLLERRKMKKIYNTLIKYKNFFKDKFLIETKTKNIEFYLDRGTLGHLMGLHYANSSKSKAGQIANLIIDNELSDEKIFERIRKNNINIDMIKDRIDNLDIFLENIEKSKLVNSKLSDNSKINSAHFLLQVEDNKFLELGLKWGVEDDYYLETFLVRNNDNNIDYSLNEEIKSFYKLDKQDNRIPFSFDEEKQKKLDEAVEIYGEIDYKKVLQEIDYIENNLWNKKKENNELER